MINIKMIVLLIAVLIILFLILSRSNLQKNMLYYPSSHLPSSAWVTAYNIAFWPSYSNDYRGFIRSVQASQSTGTIVVFHGNAGTAADREYYLNALTYLGYRVILAEYPGYGGRKGELGEESFVRDAKETLRLVSEKYGAPIFLLGESLGCGVAAAIAKTPPINIDGIILITPWDTLLSLGHEKFPWLPVRLFMRDKYDTVGNLKAYQGRIAIIGAERDEVIPIQHARALYRSLQGSHKMYTIKGAGHNDWQGMVDLQWWKEIMDFIQGNAM
jgi:pimeloyl-ACP methyl ester carboxylesterase